MQDTKQVYFNQIKGEITEIIATDNFPSVVLEVGHDSKRFVNVNMKPDLIQDVQEKYKVGDKIGFYFFVSSRFKHNRWYSMINGLKIIS